MGVERQGLMIFWSHHHLVIGRCRQGQFLLNHTHHPMSAQIFRKWHGVMIPFQLMFNCNRVVAANPNFIWISAIVCNRNFANGDHRSPINTELSRLLYSSHNPNTIGPAEFILYSKRYHTRRAKEWLILWFELHLALNIF